MEPLAGQAAEEEEDEKELLQRNTRPDAFALPLIEVGLFVSSSAHGSGARNVALPIR